MIRRTLMRRAYNSGNWEKARIHASKIIKIPKEQKLAKSIIIRSFCNEDNYLEAIRHNTLWAGELEELPELQHILMRQAYKNRDWKNAKSLAFEMIANNNQPNIAQNIVIQSNWNEGNYTELIRLNSLWENKYQELSDKAKQTLRMEPQAVSDGHSLEMKQRHHAQPVPNIDEKEWNPEDQSENFWQEGSRLWMIHPHGWTHWDMPEEFSLGSTHPDLLRLTSEILLYPWHKSTRKPLEGTRKVGSIPALAFSAGTDSTAAALIMPKNTILGYHRRNFESILDHRNADRLLKHMEIERGQFVVDVSSNHELIRTYHFKQTGFSSDFACATHLILLADHFNIGALAFGMPLDNTWLEKGRKFREFTQTQYFKYWTERFLAAGIELFFPIAGLSEAGAMKICQNEEIIPFLNSCLRGDGKNGCGKCWKCFLKNGPLGRSFDIKAKEVQIYLQRRPLPTTTHALWALQQLNLESEVPELSDYLETDLSWWTSFYPPAKQILPQRWGEEIWQNILLHLSPMKEPYLVESIDFSFE